MFRVESPWESFKYFSAKRPILFMVPKETDVDSMIVETLSGQNIYKLP